MSLMQNSFVLRRGLIDIPKDTKANMLDRDVLVEYAHPLSHVQREAKHSQRATNHIQASTWTPSSTACYDLENDLESTSLELAKVDQKC